MPEATRCLVVGLPATCFAGTSLLPEGATAISFAGLVRLSPWPAEVELVVAPLFAADFDAVELMETLAWHGYGKSLRIVAPRLPNRIVVLRELRSQAARHGLALDLVELT